MAIVSRSGAWMDRVTYNFKVYFSCFVSLWLFKGAKHDVCDRKDSDRVAVAPGKPGIRCPLSLRSRLDLSLLQVDGNILWARRQRKLLTASSGPSSHGGGNFNG